MNNLIIKFSSMVAALALIVTGVGTNGCMFFMHQPKQPKGAEKLYKF